MIETDLLGVRLRRLRDVVHESLGDATAHARGFAIRLLTTSGAVQDVSSACFDLSTASMSVQYGGVPATAYLGYGIGGTERQKLQQPQIEAFLAAMSRLRTRPRTVLGSVAAEDIAALGLADGIATLRAWGLIEPGGLDAWLKDTIEQSAGGITWSRRMRDLACDLLDSGGRVRGRMHNEAVDAVALEVCLQRTWLSAFRGADYPSPASQRMVLEKLLTNPTPEVGDLARSVVWLQALGILVEGAVASLMPSISDTVRVLQATQSALKRWVWEEKTRGGRVDPARWLIDSEAHVQAFLWAILLPIYRENLRDEQYLRGFGFTKPRYDLAIVNLKLIIEVKFARERGDFNKIEEQVAGDLGLYFADREFFDRMIVYVYDDCDVQYVEQYEGLRGALKQRDSRIEEVVIVRRPSMMPPRKARKSKSEGR